jgi:hypothetical protein
MNIREVTNEAKYVEWLTEYTFAVWKGGHTVNFYSYIHSSERETMIETLDCINVGSFENDEATLQEVKEGIKSIQEE